MNYISQLPPYTSVHTWPVFVLTLWRVNFYPLEKIFQTQRVNFRKIYPLGQSELSNFRSSDNNILFTMPNFRSFHAPDCSQKMQKWKIVTWKAQNFLEGRLAAPQESKNNWFSVLSLILGGDDNPPEGRNFFQDQKFTLCRYRRGSEVQRSIQTKVCGIDWNVLISFKFKFSKFSKIFRPLKFKF